MYVLNLICSLVIQTLTTAVITWILLVYILQLQKAICELNKRINEHDEAKASGFEKMDILVQVAFQYTSIIKGLLWQL